MYDFPSSITDSILLPGWWHRLIKFWDELIDGPHIIFHGHTNVKCLTSGTGLLFIKPVGQENLAIKCIMFLLAVAVHGDGLNCHIMREIITLEYQSSILAV